VKYKVIKGHVGEWAPGTIIDDSDLARVPGMGGVERLRDKLGVIADHHEAREPAASAAPTKAGLSRVKGPNEPRAEEPPA
jgi:hypothetical protein